MATTINVKIAPLPRGEWDNGTAYAKLDAVSYNGSSYMAIKATPAGTLPTNTTYWQVLAEQPTITDGSITTNKIADGAVTLDKLGDITGLSGEYDNMVVGSAEQLLSDTYDEESVPYAFRKSPFGDRVEEEIAGGSIAWNQLAKSLATGNYVTNNATVTYNNGVATATATVAGTYGFFQPQAYRPSIAGHRYLLSADFTIGTNSSLKYGFIDTPRITVPINTTQRIARILSTATNGNPLLVYQDSGVQIGQSFSVENLMMIDLTQMFGSAVADYIYGLETNHTGDGVAFFHAMFPNAYYAYDAGTLIHSNPTAKVVTGRNLFDKTDNTIAANKRVSTGNGGTYSSTGYSVSPYIKVLPNESYVLTTGGTSYFCFYDENKTKISYSATSWIDDYPRVSPSNAVYVRFDFSTSKIDSVQFEIGGSATAYEPYDKHTYPLSSGVLHGVPKMVNGSFAFDGDTYTSDGTITRRYGIINLGDQTWTYHSGSGNMYAENAINDRLFVNKCPAICGRYTRGFNSSDVDLASVSELTTDKTFAFMATSVPTVKGRVVVRDTAYTDAATFTTAMSGVYLVYELDTPTTESASPYVDPQYCNEYGTEEFVTAEQSGVAMITGHISKYFANLRKKIEGLPWNFSSLIAPNESTNKASQNYAVGSYLIMNNTLYKVTSAITSGGTITPGTNVSATTIMQEILAL